MSLVCSLMGHRRSRSRATFDDKRQQWVSDCRRCATILVRESDGRWVPAPPTPDKLLSIEQGPRNALEKVQDAASDPTPEDDSASLLERVS